MARVLGERWGVWRRQDFLQNFFLFFGKIDNNLRITIMLLIVLGAECQLATRLGSFENLHTVVKDVTSDLAVWTS